MKVSESVNNQTIEQMKSHVSNNQIEKSQKSNKMNQIEEQEKKQSNAGENINKEDLKEGIEKMNEAVQAFHEQMRFDLHKETDRLMVKIWNTQKHKVIKEMPPKEFLDMIGKVEKMVGLILDEKI